MRQPAILKTRRSKPMLTTTLTEGMALTKFAVSIIAIVVLLTISTFAMHVHAGASDDASSIVLTKTYTDPAYGFTLKMPADFSAYPPDAVPNRDASGNPTGEAIVLQNQKGEAAQIVITP